MGKVQESILNVQVKIMTKIMKAKKDGGKEILIELGLAIVGVVLLALFSDQFKALITTVSGKVGTAIEKLFGSLVQP